MTVIQIVGILALVLVTTPASLLAQTNEVKTNPPPAKIKDKFHPDYVRCRSEEVIGSRAQFKRTCMTNREWSMASSRQDDRANEMLTKAQRVGGLTPQ